LAGTEQEPSRGKSERAEKSHADDTEARKKTR
jgi:hypothetical protein